VNDEYLTLFSRNIGILEKDEQMALRNCRVAVAGVGGVGAIQLVNLARAGVGRFHIADPEKYQNSDTNRQYGAAQSTMNISKTEVMAKILKDINPSCEIKVFSEGVNAENLSEFIGNADVIIDAIEYYAFDEKKLLYKIARDQGKYVFSGPIFGYCTTLLVFSPDGLSYEDYFDLKTNQQLDPNRLFPIWPKYISQEVLDEITEKKRPIPSLGITASLSGALLASAIVLFYLNKKGPAIVPEVLTFDLMRGIYQVVDVTWPIFWSEYAEKYYDIVSEFTMNKQLVDEVAAMVGNNKYILDTGCGTGSLVQKLSNTNNRVKAIDISPGMIKKAIAKVGHHKNIDVSVADVTRLPFNEGEFDVVTSINVLFNLDEPLLAIREAKRVLKENGELILASMLKGEMNSEKAYQMLVAECARLGISDETREGIKDYQLLMQKKRGFKFQPTEEEIKKLIEAEGFKITYFQKTHFNHILIKAIKDIGGHP
jgi:molybdopterin/thiamine biosynthesis adenylyltransferase